MGKYKIAKTLLTFETPLSPDIKSMSYFVNRYAVFAVSVASVLCMAAGVSAAQDGNRVSPLQQPPPSLPPSPSVNADSKHDANRQEHRKSPIPFTGF